MKTTSPLLGRLLFALVVLAVCASTAHAAPVTYYSQDAEGNFAPDDHKTAPTRSNAAESAFLAVLHNYGVNDLESYANNAANPILTFGSTGVTAETSGKIIQFPALTFGDKGLLDAGPAVPTGPTVNDVFSFSAPITAFGSYFLQGGDGNPNTFTLRLENTLVSPATSVDVVVATLGPGKPFDNVFYFGVTDTNPFNQVTLLESLDYDGMIADNITIGFIPEPSSFALLSGGAAMIGLALRRQRRHRTPS